MVFLLLILYLHHLALPASFLITAWATQRNLLRPNIHSWLGWVWDTISSAGGGIGGGTGITFRHGDKDYTIGSDGKAVETVTTATTDVTDGGTYTVDDSGYVINDITGTTGGDIPSPLGGNRTVGPLGAIVEGALAVIGKAITTYAVTKISYEILKSRGFLISIRVVGAGG